MGLIVDYDPTFNLAQAAKVCNVSPSTIRRSRDRLVEGGATFHDRSWKIPLSALIYAGFTPSTPSNDRSWKAVSDRSMIGQNDRSDRSLEGQKETPENPAAQELDELRTEVQRLTHALEIAEVKNEGLERMIETQQLALRALEAGTARPAEQPRETPAQTPPTQPAPKAQETVFDDTNAPWNQPEPPRGFLARLFKH